VKHRLARGDQIVGDESPMTPPTRLLHTSSRNA
jgi:hypothetical protein